MSNRPVFLVYNSFGNAQIFSHYDSITFIIFPPHKSKRVHNMVYKRVLRGWTAGQSLSIQNFEEYSPSYAHS